MNDDVVSLVIFVLLIILLIPTFIQIKYGVRALAGWSNMKFGEIALFCFFGELILGIVMFFIVAFVSSFFIPAVDTPRCGFGFAGIAVFSIPIAFLNLIIALFQKLVLK
ncbi:MAG TPA: hypothetical protein VN182_01430 [Flavobacterium sp.]|nr:hypothetical protein [Flavobacterium sp.]